jgi:hypothetical protein
MARRPAERIGERRRETNRLLRIERVRRLVKIMAGGRFGTELIWNEYDVVPHAWTNIMNVQPYEAQNDILWDPTLKFGICVKVPTLIAQRWFQPDFKPLVATAGAMAPATTATSPLVTAQPK